MDTNICVKYSFNFNIPGRQGSISLHLQGSKDIDIYLKSYIDKKNINICNTVYVESTKKIWDIASDQSIEIPSKNPFLLRRIIATKAIDKLLEACDCRYYEDNFDAHSTVKELYDCIWKDSSNKSKIQFWCQVKNKEIEYGPPRGNDLIILSTAIFHSKYNELHLLTCDNDFLVFKDEIQNRFNILVIGNF